MVTTTAGAAAGRPASTRAGVGGVPGTTVGGSARASRWRRPSAPAGRCRATRRPAATGRRRVGEIDGGPVDPDPAAHAGSRVATGGRAALDPAAISTGESAGP